MGRTKARPHRSVGTLQPTPEPESTHQSPPKPGSEPDTDKPYFVQVDRTTWLSDHHFDISEILLTNLTIPEKFQNRKLTHEFYSNSNYSLRFRLINVNEFLGRIKCGHWPVLNASNIVLEFVENGGVEDVEMGSLMVFGDFDGPDEGVTGLAHLVNLRFLSLRPVLGVNWNFDEQNLRLRVELLKNAFDSCESVLDNARHLWKKSMMSVMAWLRPEVMTSEARYGNWGQGYVDMDFPVESAEDSGVLRERASFDVAGFYEAIKPSKEDPMLQDDLPDLLPELRPYQRRAAYWMVQREKGPSGSECLDKSERNPFISPLCVPVNLIDSNSKIFYNPFSGNVALCSQYSSPYIFGGILADEMGLGKTVELLACIFAHRKSESEGLKLVGDQKNKLKRLKRERVECLCGAVNESSKYKGLWVQCDICDAWQHADCVGFSAKGKTSKSGEISRHIRRKNNPKILEMGGDHICQLCSELIQVTDSPIPAGATLIVCPAPILSQWHAEIIRHTNPGSLKTYVYEGVKDTSLSNTSVTDIGELLSADIVLTTYDVLKEDLSHDSDRHEGDRRLMRFEKRYPVIPTLLTRVFWWRICLDEAQMVESNAAAATEMALRLHAKYRWCITGTPIQRKLDDLYGLLRFLKASPFDVLRWWIEVIRDPYERGDAGAMTFTHNLFKPIMWRSSKAYVTEELMLPPQEECIYWLSLSPIEEHFYQRQHETCVDYAREVIESFKNVQVTGSKPSDAPSDPFITHVEAAKLFNSLLKLRQACCHPQVGSYGLRSLQQSPMTMEEILSVLVDKTKVEGEEALRRFVISLNGLAGIAIIKQNFPQAASLYKEALAFTEEHSEDFRLDPLLNIHIHHNLADILPFTSDYVQKFQLNGQFSQSSKDRVSKMYDTESCDQHASKRKKVSREDSSDLTIDSEYSPEFSSNKQANSLNGDKNSDVTSYQHLRIACENLKQKFLSVSSSKLSLAQQEFRKSYGQVCTAFGERENQHTTWWLEALHHIEQNKDLSSELIRKIGEDVSGALNTSKKPRIASCFRSITALKYYIQTGLDALEDSRKSLLDRLLDIDQTMGNPKEEDIESVRHCPNCQANDDGLLCVHCELDKLFQVYAARLFRLNKANGGVLITSAEEAVDLQRKNSALNYFHRTLSQPDKNSSSSRVTYEENGKKRDIGERVVVSRSPSELEVSLGIIKSYSKAMLGREGLSAAKNQLLLLEGMRKEYAQARSLATAQAQVLRAHDEIKMATSRLRLKDDESDKSIDALSPGELEAANVENSSDKFLALSLLSRIKGQLRFLKGLVQSKQNLQLERPNDPSLMQVKPASETSPTEMKNECPVEAEEACPVCQEKLSNKKMVYQCGHVTCCKCLFYMTERRLAHLGNFRDTSVMCPTCRQHTDFGNIAYVDDRQNKSCNSSLYEDCENSEAATTVQGSYGTKIEAVTRKILWINSTDPKAKILVFSSWNDVLDVLEHAFNANNISCLRMKGGRKSHVAVSQFRGQQISGKVSGKMCDRPPETRSVQVLLLLIQHGANGLNLLEAQHVILVEPLLNPAAEAQAISRVHRIGQNQKTIVHRFIVKDTVEESIYKLNKSRNTGSFISGNTKNRDQPVLTLKDVKSIFKVVPSTVAENDENPSGSLRHLPPSEAAVIAAEWRRMERST